MLISQFLSLTLYFFTMVKKQKKAHDVRPLSAKVSDTLSWALEPPEFCERVFLLFYSFVVLQFGVLCYSSPREQTQSL